MPIKNAKNVIKGWQHHKNGGVHIKKIMLCLMFVLAMSLNVKAMGENQGINTETTIAIANKYVIPISAVKEIERNNNSSLYVVKKMCGDAYLSGLIDGDENIILPFEYLDIEKGIGNLEFMVNKNNRWGIVDINNNAIVECKYDDIFPFRMEYYAAIENDGRVDYYKIKDGKESFLKTLDGYVKAIRRDSFAYYVDEFDYSVQTNNRGIKKYGLTDYELSVVIKPEYYNAVRFDVNGYAIVEKGKGLGIIDKKGRKVLDTVYDEVHYEGKGVYFCGKKNKKENDFRRIELDGGISTYVKIDMITKHINLLKWEKILAFYHTYKKMLIVFVIGAGVCACAAVCKILKRKIV